MPDSPQRHATSFRAQAQNVEFNEPMKFATPVHYHSGDPTAAIDSENYFLSCRHLLTAGDEIHVACIRDDGTWDKALYEVTLCDERSVVVQRLGAWRHGGRLVAPRLKAVHERLGTWRVEDPHGKVVRRNLSKPEAYALAGLRLEEPEEETKDGPGNSGKGARKTVAHKTTARETGARKTTARTTPVGKKGEAA